MRSLLGLRFARALTRCHFKFNLRKQNGGDPSVAEGSPRAAYITSVGGQSWTWEDTKLSKQVLVCEYKVAAIQVRLPWIS
jgi:hypothetical protein